MTEYKVIVNDYSTVTYYKPNTDIIHREDGPAVEYANGNKYWYLNGKYHREYGPAVEKSNGDKEWYLNGELHREGGPAVEYASGDKYWYLNGEHHREYGPAVEKSNGDKEWYLNGVRKTKDEYCNRKITVELTLDEIAKKFDINVNQLKIKK